MDTKKILSNLDLALAGVAFVILIVVTFGGVIMRYILSSPLAWAEEVQLWMFLWITFLGAGAAFRSVTALMWLWKSSTKSCQ